MWTYRQEAGHDSLVNMLQHPIKPRLFLEERRFRSRCDMLFHSIRSSNTLSLGSGKLNCVLGFSANRVWLVSRFYIVILLHYYKERAFSIPTINR